MIEHASAPIKSVELQLIRVETVAHAEGVARDGTNVSISSRPPVGSDFGIEYTTATEIQNVQIGWGDVCRQMAIPIYMIFPRLFTCPTMLTSRMWNAPNQIEQFTHVTFFLTCGL